LLGIKAETLRVNIDSKSAYWSGWVSLGQNLTQKGTSKTKKILDG